MQVALCPDKFIFAWFDKHDDETYQNKLISIPSELQLAIIVLRSNM